MHPECWEYVDRAVAETVRTHAMLRTVPSVLDIGGQNVNGSLRDLFNPCGADYLAVDIYDGPGVDLVANCATLRLERLFDVVLCTEVLEHTPEWPQIVETCALHAKPGGLGLVVITAATDPRKPHSWTGVEPPPDDEYYQNVSPDALREIAATLLDDVDVSTHPRGDVRLTGKGKVPGA